MANRDGRIRVPVLTPRAIPQLSDSDDRSGDRDPIAFTILRTTLEAITDEMLVSIMRTAHTSIIRDGMDFSVAICTPIGETAVQGFAVPLHLGAIPDAIAGVIRRFGDDFRPGDLVMMNDPYWGGMHLPDIFLIQPCFARGRLLAFLVAVADFGDVGGRVAGGRPVDAKSVFEEGIRIPPVKFVDGGVESVAVSDIIRQNVRLPDQTLADLGSVRAALETGAARFDEVVGRFGDHAVGDFMEQTLSLSEAVARRYFSTLPDCEAEFTDHIDDSVINDAPLSIKVRLTVSGSNIEVDFSGTSAQVPASINATLSFTRSAVYAAIRTLLPLDAPTNSGLFRPIDVKADPGTIVNAAEPAPVANRGLVGYRVVDTVLGGLASIVSGRTGAAGEGGGSSIRVAGSFQGREFVIIDSIHGTWGGRAELDGLDGCANFAANSSNHPIEILEADAPIRVLSYSLATDSGGAGRHRGGMGIDRVWELLADSDVTLRTDRTKFAPWGLDGGLGGRLAVTVVELPDGTSMNAPAKAQLQLPAGSKITHRQASGGGYGPRFSRAPEAVLIDWVEERITTTHARDTYGVAINEASMSIDRNETQRLRTEREDDGTMGESA
jgi:N-methylhydantoinase B